MVTKDNFIEMISLAERFDAEVDRWNLFGIQVFEMPIAEIPWQIFDNWSASHFNGDGIDWINWYLFERKDWNTNQVLPCYDENNEEFYVNTPEDLWNLVKEYITTGDAHMFDPINDNK